MHLKWFRGRRMPEVMRLVREELGPEAVILHSKSTRPWGPLRFLGGGGVEILAAVDRPEAPLIPPVTRSEPTAPRAAEAVRAELAELRTLFLRSAGGPLVPPALGHIYERLLSGGMDPGLAVRILNTVPPFQAEGDLGDLAACRAVEEHITRMIAVAGCAEAPGPLRVALVGPAGAGKTTTLAKLAARAQITGGRIAIVNADGSGFGGRGPLEPLAALLEVPYLLALTPAELAAPLPLPAPRACVLIDTPGVGPDDRPALARLGELLRAAAPDEVHLVLSATSKAPDAHAAIRAFSTVGATHLLFTHLDETASCASVLDACVESGLPLSYVGTGREIPGDLVPADPRRLIRRALQGAPTS